MRTRRLPALLAVCGLLCIASLCRAQEHGAPPSAQSSAHAAPGRAAAAAADADDDLPHPALPQDGTWAGAMVIIILGMFLAAAAVGVTVRMNMPDELPPPAHAHDEPPGSSHHHGRSGTINRPEPEDDLRRGHGH